MFSIRILYLFIYKFYFFSIQNLYLLIKYLSKKIPGFYLTQKNNYKNIKNLELLFNILKLIPKIRNFLFFHLFSKFIIKNTNNLFRIIF